MTKKNTDEFDEIGEYDEDYDPSYAKRKKDSFNKMQKTVLPLMFAQNMTSMSTGNTGALPFNPFGTDDEEDREKLGR